MPAPQLSSLFTTLFVSGFFFYRLIDLSFTCSQVCLLTDVLQADRAMKVSEEMVACYPASARAWSQRLQLLCQTLASPGDLVFCLDTALRTVPEQVSVWFLVNVPAACNLYASSLFCCPSLRILFVYDSRVLSHPPFPQLRTCAADHGEHTRSAIFVAALLLFWA